MYVCRFFAQEFIHGAIHWFVCVLFTHCSERKILNKMRGFVLWVNLLTFPGQFLTFFWMRFLKTFVSTTFASLKTSGEVLSWE